MEQDNGATQLEAASVKTNSEVLGTSAVFNALNPAVAQVGPAASPTTPFVENPNTQKQFQQQYRHNSRNKAIVATALLVLIMLLLSGGLFLRRGDTNSALSNVVTIPLEGVIDDFGLSVSEAGLLAVNGQLTLNGVFVISASETPEDPVQGQFYVSDDTGDLNYFNGEEFVTFAGRDELVTLIQEQAVTLIAGTGIGVNGGTISNNGVLSFQGQTGDVALTQGAGIGINGNTISNSGVISLIAGSGITVTSNGGGGFTIAAASGTGDILGSGTANQVAFFDGTKTITSSANLLFDGNDLDVAVGTLFVDQSTGRVGVGTTSPASKLTVAGTVRTEISNSSSNSVFLSLNNSDTTNNNGGVIQFRGQTTGAGATERQFANIGAIFNEHDDATRSSSLTFSTSNSGNPSVKVTIQGNGNVGIGTTAPLGLLDIYGAAFSTAETSYTGLTLNSEGVTAGSGNYGVGIEFSKLGSPTIKKAAIAPVQTDADRDVLGLAFFVSKSTFTNVPVVEVMRIDGLTGNVGIGTTTPNAPLTVESTAAYGATIKRDIISTTAGSGLSLESKNTLGGYRVSGQIYGILTNNTSGAEQGALSFGTRDAGAVNERLRITNVGNVGIGTTVPAEKLEVSGGDIQITDSVPLLRLKDTDINGHHNIQSANASLVLSADPTDVDASSSILFNIDGSSRAIITSSGNVGIGTITPSAMLSVGSSSQFQVNASGQVLYVDGTTDSNTLVCKSSAGRLAACSSAALTGTAFIQNGNSFGAAAVLGTNDAYDLQLKTNNTTRLTIDTSGNVGIGTTAPGAKLEVQGGNFIVSDTDFVMAEVKRASNDSGGAEIRLHKTRGTLAAPLAVQSGDLIGAISFVGYNGSITEVGSQIYGYAAENWTGSANGSNLTFRTTPLGSTFELERVRIDANGNVGIGDTAPGTKLEVLSTSSQLRLTHTKGVYSTSFTVDGTGDLTVAPSGNDFLITGNLDVSANAAIGSQASVSSSTLLNILGSSGSTAGPFRGIYVQPTQSTELLSGTETVSGITSAPIFAASTVNGDNSLQAYAALPLNNGTGTVANVTGLRVELQNSSTGTITNGFGLLVKDPINPSGIITNNIGIRVEDQTVGTNNSLLVLGTTSPTGNYSLYNSSTYNNYFAGNVGIGSTTPTQKLHVAGQGFFATSSVSADPGDGSGAGIRIGYNNTLDAGYINANNTGVASKNLLLQHNGGNVGIGDTTPSALLTVGSGDLFQVASSGNLTTSNAGTWTFSNDTNFVLSGGVNGLSFDGTTLSIDATNDRVGIGTATPTAPLEVVGPGTGAVISLTSPINTQLDLTSTDTGGGVWRFASLGNVAGREGNLEIQDNNNNARPIVIRRQTSVVAGYKAIYIDSNGRVGIGNNTAPAALFTVGVGDLFQVSSAGLVTYVNGAADTNTLVCRNAAGQLAACSSASVGGTAFVQNGNSFGGLATLGTNDANALALETNGIERVRIDTSGNVGIGTTGGTYPLQVMRTGGGGIARFSSDQSSGTIYISNSSQTDQIGLNANGTSLRLLTGGLAKLTIDSTGNTGIGITSPSELLSVSGRLALAETTSPTDTANYGKLFVKSSDSALYFRNDSGTEYNLTLSGTCATCADTALSNLSSVAINTSLLPASDDAIDLGSDTKRWRDLYLGGETIHIGGSTIDEGLISYDATANILQFGTDATTNGDIAFNTNHLYIDKSSGNIGFKTTAPAKALDVAGDNKAVGVSQTSYSWNAGGNLIGAEYGAWDSGRTNAAGTYYYRWTGGATAHHLAYAGQVQSTALGEWGYGIMTGSAASLTQATTTRLYVSVAGNVGIGTTSPGAKLDILHGSASGTALRLSDISTDVTTKQARLVSRHYTNSQPDAALLFGNNTSTANQILIGGGLASYNAATQLSFYTAANNTTTTGTERLRIDSTGNVGIGTTAPDQKLSVEGQVGYVEKLNFMNFETTGDVERVVKTAGTAGRDLTANGYGKSESAATVEIFPYSHTKILPKGWTGYVSTLMYRTNYPGNGYTRMYTSSDGATWTQVYTHDDTGVIGTSSATFTWTNSTPLANDSYLRIVRYNNYAGAGTTNRFQNVLISNIVADKTARQNSGTLQVNYTTGNVGIGATAPVSRLDVIQNNSTAYATTGLAWDAQAFDVAQFQNENTTSNFASILLRSVGPSGNATGRVAVVNSAGGDSALAFLLRSSAHTSSTDEKLRITHEGRVGIGTSAPANPLHVSVATGATVAIAKFHSTAADSIANISLQNDARIWQIRNDGSDSDKFNIFDATAAQTRLAIDSAGNVGIGDSSPASLLTVGASDAFQVSSSGRVLANFGASGAGNLAYSFVGDTDTGLYRSAANEIRLQTTGTDRLTIDASGNVGIGVTGPATKLDVAGDIRLSSGNGNGVVTPYDDFVLRADDDNDSSGDLFSFQGNGSTEYLVVDNGGNLGVGTSTPGTKLSVDGGNNIDLEFPDGLAGTTVQQQINSSSSYTVPSGKNLYITNAIFSSSTGSSGVEIDGVIAGISESHQGTKLALPIVAAAGEVVDATSATDVYITGIVVNEGVTPITTVVDSGTSYTVPAGKRFVIFNVYASSDNDLEFDGDEVLAVTSQASSEYRIQKPLIAEAGTVIDGVNTDDIHLNGYLTDENGYGGADLAERYLLEGYAEAGDVLEISPNSTTDKPLVRKATSAFAENLIGVYTTAPFKILSDKNTADPELNTADVALVGRVPVKVTMEGGQIKSGDPLTSSSKAGYAMKANGKGKTLGLALEDFSCDTEGCEGTVMTFIDSGYSAGKAQTNWNLIGWIAIGAGSIGYQLMKRFADTTRNFQKLYRNQLTIGARLRRLTTSLSSFFF